MKDSRTFFLLDFVDLESIPSVFEACFFLLSNPELFFREGVCQALKGGPGLRKSFKPFGTFLRALELE